MPIGIAQAAQNGSPTSARMFSREGRRSRLNGFMSTSLSGSALAETVFGALQSEVNDAGVRPWRLPETARRYATPALALMAEFTAGVRLRFVTSARTLELDVTVTRLVQTGQKGPGASAPFVATIDGRPVDRVDLVETSLVHETAEKTYERGESRRSRVELTLPEDGDAGERVVEVWLPQDAGVVLHTLSADAPLRTAAPINAARWLHYGSSISHGGSADSPLGTWPRLAAAELGLDSVSLGFGGNAMLDPLVARAISRASADVITLKVGINIVGADAMRKRTLIPALHGFIDTIRDGHPRTPIAVITAIGCPAVETTPGPIRAGSDGKATGTPREIRPGDGTLTLVETRTIVAQIIAARTETDSALHLVDGLALLSVDEDDRLPDGLHPDQAGYDLMAKRFAALARDPSTEAGKAFAEVLVTRKE